MLDFPYIGVVGIDKLTIEYNDTHYRYVDDRSAIFQFGDAGFNYKIEEVTPIEVFNPVLMEECEYSFDMENWFPCTVVNFKPLIVYTPNDKEITVIEDTVYNPSGIVFREKVKDDHQEFIEKTALIVQDHIYDECIAEALWDAGYRLPTSSK